MNRRTFERLVERAIAGIPAAYLERVENLTFQVEGWADAETLREVGFDDRRDLLGFFRGVALTERSVAYGGEMPDQIILYQNAIEDYAHESDEPLMKVIRETILHELAHYFGFSEEDLAPIEDFWAGEGKDGGAA